MKRVSLLRTALRLAIGLFLGLAMPSLAMISDRAADGTASSTPSESEVTVGRSQPGQMEFIRHQPQTRNAS